MSPLATLYLVSLYLYLMCGCVSEVLVFDHNMEIKPLAKNLEVRLELVIIALALVVV